MEYIFASHNAGKVAEVAAIFARAGINVKPLSRFGRFTPEETADTFTGNAVLKATQSLEWLKANGITDALVIADDSGLCVDALGGKPGVMSARFMGEDTPYEEKNNAIIEMLTDVPDGKRTARFVCVMAAAYPSGKVVTAEGFVEGVIARAQYGSGGFGYDPIFFLPQYGLTTAELPFEEKNRVSHRNNAAVKLMELITRG